MSFCNFPVLTLKVISFYLFYLLLLLPGVRVDMVNALDPTEMDTTAMVSGFYDWSMLTDVRAVIFKSPMLLIWTVVLFSE